MTKSSLQAKPHDKLFAVSVAEALYKVDQRGDVSVDLSADWHPLLVSATATSRGILGYAYRPRCRGPAGPAFKFDVYQITQLNGRFRFDCHVTLKNWQHLSWCKLWIKRWKTPSYLLI